MKTKGLIALTAAAFILNVPVILKGFDNMWDIYARINQEITGRRLEASRKRYGSEISRSETSEYTPDTGISPVSVPNEAPDNSDLSDDSNPEFVISDGTLISYNGSERNVVIPDNVDSIGDRAFWSRNFVETVEIPSSVKKIGECSFWSCDSLKYVNIEEGLEAIGDTAFWSCMSLEDVNLPASVTNIGTVSFGCCYALKIHTPQGSYAQAYASMNNIPCDNELK